MKNSKLFTVLASLAIALLFATASYAQAPQVVGVGSSALFPSVAIGAVSADPITGSAAQCGTSFWSGGSSLAYGLDSRSDGGTPVPHEPGSLWVAWGPNDTAPTTVCAYLSVDSVVGQRLFLGQSATGNATLVVAAGAKTTAGGNKVSYVLDVCSAGAVPASANVSSITEAGTTATFTATAPLATNFANGASVTISGSTVAAYNGTFTIGNVTATTFTFTTTAGAGADAAGVANIGMDCPGLPVAVYNLINNAHFNVAFTDIRAEDGQYAYHRAACTLIPGDATKACMGYGPEGHIGTAILSSYTSASAQVVAYAISGTDPLSGLGIPAFTTIPVGGEPVVVFVNTSNAAAGHLGNAAFTDVPVQVLSNYYSGYAGGTADMNPSVLPNNALIHIVEREPVSGTYNTFEFGAIRTAADNRVRSQELGNTPTAPCFVPPAAPVACGNPLWLAGADTATRARAIGTGEMVTDVSAGNAAINPVDSLGYAFFSLGTFGGKANIKYLTVGGLDPIYANGTNPAGAFPNCSGYFNVAPVTFACGAPGLPTFNNVIAGNYRPWSVLRAVTFVPSPAAVASLILAAQDQAAPTSTPHIGDFVPSRYCANAGCGSFVDGLPVFKSHYGISGFTPDNGIISGTESGGDMAGQTFTDQAEKDYDNFVGGGAILYNYFQ